jgi:hypothetical protein
VGHLGKTFRRARDNATEYRRFLEAETMTAHGEIGVVRAHLIDAAAGFELHGGVCRWIIRNRLDKMSPLDVANVSAQLAKCRVERNRAVMALGLDTETDTAFDLLPALELAQAAVESPHGGNGTEITTSTPAATETPPGAPIEATEEGATNG